MTETRRWFIFAGIILLGFAVYALSSVLTPFLTAALLAYLMDPLVNALQARKIPRVLAVVMVFFILLFVFVSLFIFFIPLLEHQVILFFNNIPLMIDWLQNNAVPFLQKYFGVSDNINVDFVKEKLTANLQESGVFAKNIWTTISASSFVIFNWLANLVLIPVVMFYMLRDWDGIVKGMGELLPRSVAPIVETLVRECDEVLGAFLRGQLMVMLCLGLIYALGLWIIDIELAMLIGMIAGLVSIVPYLGFIVGILAAWIAAMLQFHDLWYLAYVAFVFMVAQSIESMFLTPLFVGDRIGLHPVAVIFAVLSGAQLFGFVGILLALPVAAVLMVFIRYFKKQYQQSDLYGDAGGDETCLSS